MIVRLAHQLQGLAHALIGNEAEERRLLELDGQALAQGVVKNGVTGFVGEVGEDDGVRFAERVGFFRVVKPAATTAAPATAGVTQGLRLVQEGGCMPAVASKFVAVWPDSKPRRST